MLGIWRSSGMLVPGNAPEKLPLVWYLYYKELPTFRPGQVVWHIFVIKGFFSKKPFLILNLFVLIYYLI